MYEFLTKLQSLAFSRRFWVAVASVVVVFLHETLGFDRDSAEQLVMILMAWILGDSLSKTGAGRVGIGAR